jgi:predicted permease
MLWIRRLLKTLRSSRTRGEIERELSFHLAERVDQLQSEGLSREEAMRRARAMFGHPAVQVERTRDMDIALGVEALLRSIRHAFRSLAGTPGFSATVVTTLAIGIGANTAVFSTIDAILLRPLPFPHGDRLVRVRQAEEVETALAPGRLEDWSRSSSTMEAITGFYTEEVSDTTRQLPERVRRAVVAPRFLQVLGVTPALGRDFSEAELHLGGPRALLISDRYWRRHFAAAADVLAATVRLEGRAYSIVGVMPASFAFPDPRVDLWWPYPSDAPLLRDGAQSRRLQWYTGIGRLKPGVTRDQAAANLGSIQARLAVEYPETDAGIGVRIAPYKETMVGGVRESLWLLFGAVSVLLLVACTNIAALLLSRAARREHEIAVRFSLGASRAAVAGQLLTETTLLALAGSAAGLLVAVSASAVIRTLAPDLPRLEEVGVDRRILAYTTISAVLVALLCGLFPAIRSTRGALDVSRSGRTLVSGGNAVQWTLAGLQIALSVTLLAGAALLVRSAQALAQVDAGFDPQQILAFRVSGNWTENQDRDRLVERIDASLEGLATLPGVEAVATSWGLPGSPRSYQIEFELAGGRSKSEPSLVAEWRTVSPGYFGTIRIPLLEGEPCRRRPPGGLPTEVMVNRSFARRYFEGRPVIGQHLTWENASQTGRIAGVVGDAREAGIDRDPAPTVYACDIAPNPFPWFLVRTQGEPLALAGAIRVELAAREPLRSVYDLMPLDERIGDAYAQNRLRTALLTVFAATALSLACLGIYATLSYAVSRRRREVGLRLALGGRRSQIIRELAGQGLRVVILASVCGLGLSLVLTHSLAGMLYGVSPSDPATLAVVVWIVLSVGSLAAMIPAARASLLDPVRVLREE